MTIVPSLRYKDAKRAIEWLCEAFGFEKGLVIPGEGETIRHSRLTLGTGMIMVGTAREGEHGGDPTTDMESTSHGTYVCVEDPEAHCARARAAGAEIVQEVEEQPHIGRLYACRDLEGHAWVFGEHDPWSLIESD